MADEMTGDTGDRTDNGAGVCPFQETRQRVLLAVIRMLGPVSAEDLWRAGVIPARPDLEQMVGRGLLVEEIRRVRRRHVTYWSAK